MIPMRDGVKLHMVILRPAGSEKGGEALPFLMDRTPYGVDWNTSDVGECEQAGAGGERVHLRVRGYSRAVRVGWAVCDEPAGGRAGNGKSDVDETTDTRDTIDWLLKNVLEQQRQGGCVRGVAIRGFLAMMAGIDAHPAVKAISPAGSDDGHLDGGRLLPQRRVPRDVRVRLCAAAGGAEDGCPGELEGGHVRLLPAKRELRGCGEAGGDDAAADGEGRF